MDDGVWLLCHCREKKFDIRVEDKDSTSVMDLVDDIIEDQ